MSDTAIVWLRRDLRIEDNPALHCALDNADRVIPVYIHAPDEETPWQAGAASNWWLHESLTALEKALGERGSRLVVRRGGSLQVLCDLVGETGAGLVCWSRLYDPVTIPRDREIKSTLRDQGIECRSLGGALLREPWEMLKDDDTMYRVYTPFSKRYFADVDIACPVSIPDRLPTVPRQLASDRVSDLGLLPEITWYRSFADYWQPGESGAMLRLNDFIDREAVFDYGEGRNLPAQDGVSGLSPHLHFGEISARQAWHAIRHAADAARDDGLQDAADRARAYLRQLVWRDFAHHILYHLPETAEEPFNQRFRGFSWEHDATLLEAWQRGETGIPLVDAGMRQLWHTGWMHNRLRMLVASVLTKNGLIHWLEGARWFWDTLVDADLANNSMGWQWTAGCGVDAAPYFRIFAPARQGERFDPDGDYVRTWVPELKDLPAKHIHEPWKAPAAVLRDAGVRLDENYPAPVIDLRKSREEALRRFKALD